MKCGVNMPPFSDENGVKRWKSGAQFEDHRDDEADSRQATPAVADPRELALS